MTSEYIKCDYSESIGEESWCIYKLDHITHLYKMVLLEGSQIYFLPSLNAHYVKDMLDNKVQTYKVLTEDEYKGEVFIKKL